MSDDRDGSSLLSILASWVGLGKRSRPSKSHFVIKDRYTEPETEIVIRESTNVVRLTKHKDGDRKQWEITNAQSVGLTITISTLITMFVVGIVVLLLLTWRYPFWWHGKAL